MKKHYIYIFYKTKDKPLNVGFSKDIIATIEFENKKPSLIENKLVYMEIAESVEAANDRFELIYKMNREKKIELIEVQNPDWITLLPGVNIDM